MSCEEVRLALGAFVLGALDADEAARVQAHLDDCAGCRAELDELRAMPTLLGLVTLDDVTAAATPPPVALREHIVRRAVAERRAARRRRVGWSAAGGVVIAAAAAAAGFVLADGGAVVPTPAEPPGQVLSAVDAETGVRGTLSIDGVGWGSRLQLELAGVEPGEICTLVAVGESGLQTTSTWQVPLGVGKETFLKVPGAAALPPGMIEAYEVVTDRGTVLRLTSADATNPSEAEATAPATAAAAKGSG